MKLNKEGTGLIPYNETTESALFKGDDIQYPLEFAKNKLFVTSDSHMYLVVDWCVAKCIFDPIENTYKT